MGAWLAPPTCATACALVDTLFCVVTPVADVSPDAAVVCPPEPDPAGTVLSALPDVAAELPATITVAEL